MCTLFAIETMSWQRNIDNIEEKLVYILMSGQLSDVTLIVGTEEYHERFNLHRFILSIYSEVFEALFYGSMADKNEEIKLSEDDPCAFRIVISYMYTSKAEFNTIEEAISTFYVADKYLVYPIRKLCIDYLMNNITSNTVVDIYQLADMMKEESLIIMCLNHIEQFSKEVLAGDSFLKASFSTILSLFQEAELKLESQSILYNAVISWGQNVCKREGKEPNDFNVRTKMGPFLHWIEFTTMSAEEFVNGPGSQEILTEAEQLNILKNIIKPGATALPKICSNQP